MLTFMLIVGLVFSLGSRFFQIRLAKTWLRETLISCFTQGKNMGSPNGISAFSAMTTALAGAMGTGNIVGVATAISLGGAGAVFWMWVASILGMMTIFAENVLGFLYKTKDKQGNTVGGPMYYISRGLKSKPLALMFCLACITASLSMGNMTQSNSIAEALSGSFHVSKTFTAAVITAIITAVIIGGIKRISSVTEKIVPLMSLFFMLGGIVVISYNSKALPDVFGEIVTQAFSLNAAASGVGGYVIANAIKQGVSKGVFSNEAGLGSSPIIYSASDMKSPVEQGMWGIFQVFADTIVGCSITALCILSTGVTSSTEDGVSLSMNAFSSVFGSFGEIFVAVSIVLFAFATLISWSYYGERCITFLTGGKGIAAYRVIYVVAAGVGCLLEINIVWGVADIVNVLMAVPNLIAILLLSKQVFSVIGNYEAKRCVGCNKKKAWAKLCAHACDIISLAFF